MLENWAALIFLIGHMIPLLFPWQHLWNYQELEEAMTKTTLHTPPLLYIHTQFVSVCVYTYTHTYTQTHTHTHTHTLCKQNAHCVFLDHQEQHRRSKQAPCWKHMWNHLLLSILSVRNLKLSYSTCFASAGKQEIKRTTNS